MRSAMVVNGITIIPFEKYAKPEQHIIRSIKLRKRYYSTTIHLSLGAELTSVTDHNNEYLNLWVQEVSDSSAARESRVILVVSSGREFALPHHKFPANSELMTFPIGVCPDPAKFKTWHVLEVSSCDGC